MNYSNAKKGFSKLFVAEMLMILSSVLGTFTDKALVLGLVAVIMMIVAFFINLSGLSLMAKDDKGYKKAYNFTIAGIIITVAAVIVGVIFKDNSFIYECANGISNVSSRVFEYITAILVMKASIEVLTKLNKDELVKKTKSTYILYSIAYALAIILGIIADTTNVLVGVLVIIGTLVALVLGLVSQIKYYIFLKNMANTL